MVCVSACLLVTFVNPGKRVELIDMLFGEADSG